MTSSSPATQRKSAISISVGQEVAGNLSSPRKRLSQSQQKFKAWKSTAKLSLDRPSPQITLVNMEHRDAHSHNTGTTASAMPAADAKSTKTAKKPSRQKKNAGQLRRVKNSTEVLRQRSLKKGGRDAAADFYSDLGMLSREGRQFTVGNVGNNGLLYLRPMTKAVAADRTPTRPLTSSAKPGATRLVPRPRADPITNVRNSLWSISQASELPQLIVHKGRRSESVSECTSAVLRPTNHQRAYSCSTIDTQPNQTHDKRNTFKIVINRTESGRPKSAERSLQQQIQNKEPRPVLEVPIPHWRLGSPQFTGTGTPLLRSSVYTQTRASGSVHPRSSQFLSGDFDHLFPVPPPAMLRLHSTDSCVLHSSMLHPAKPESAVSGFSGVTGSSAALPSPGGFFELAEPAEPEIFDAMAVNMDDPVVVRYAPRTKDIIAATPARIVAEVSSENFMDYELVSDFFLTFRSYLSPGTLLSLLLARLHWAINRLQDDGRIIRIRTFAALRHWILNYFVDDFVPDLAVRVLFCDKINMMYKEVKARTGGGVSDLKILLDLKKCWNGRCAMYWESADLAGEGRSDEELLPGGMDGSETGSLRSHNAVVEFASVDQVIDEPRTTMQSWFGEPPGVSPSAHRRNVSASTTQSVPMSPASELSIQPFSCSLPSLRKNNAQPKTAQDAHPVPVTPSTTNPQTASSAPPPSVAWRRPHAHKRSGSFSDSVRDDRTPLPFAQVENPEDSFLVVSPHWGSLIRGHMFHPTHPFVDVLAPSSPQPEGGLYSHAARQSDSYLDMQSRPALGASPAVRGIIGSIRRALSTRQSPSRPPGMARGKNSMLSLNVSNDIKAKPIGFKNRVRIDLLCAQISQNYESALQQGRSSDPVPANAERGDAIDHAFFETPKPFTEPGVLTDKMGSGMTMGSKSIFIVDDTKPEVPAMSGALEGLGASLARSDGPGSTVEGTSEMGQADTRASRHNSRTSHRAAEVRASWRSSSVDRFRISRPSLAERVDSTRSASSQRSTNLGRKRLSNSTMLRKYASYQSTIAKRADRSSMVTQDAGLIPSSPLMLDDEFEPPKSRILRRRPGGDLRNNTNVHDLELEFKHNSGGSFTTATDSMMGSALFMARNRTPTGPQSPATQTSSVSATNLMLTSEAQPKAMISMINTHSTRPLRPSFEAAVAAFARIPDDDDGGRDSTLLKLEGKYIRPPSLIRTSPTTSDNRSSGLSEPTSSDCYDLSAGILPGTPGIGEVQSIALDSRLDVPSSSDHNNARVSVHSVSVSDMSYCSIPLLERGLGDYQSPTKEERPFSGAPSSQAIELFDSLPVDDSSHPSIEVVTETESIKEFARALAAKDAQPTSSFLLDDDEDRFSDLSSEMSVEIIDHEEVQDKRFPSPFTAAPGTAVSSIPVPSHPLAHPPSPPNTLPNTVANTPHTQFDHMMFHDNPPTPEPSPTHPKVKLAAPPVAPAPPPPAIKNNGHIAFILACDSEVLAQQFTLVEKAALSEVDWKDLVDMRWKSNVSSALNWVEVLQNPSMKGLDLAIARFNIMVKWVLSEIVMTQNIHERAQTITKYIHVASHCRKLRNYATMLQIVIALSARDCASLTKTWDLIPDTEKQALGEMDSLIQPVRNFHDLRIEMETTDLQDGCIPFVGLYVHDLTYNAQKPAQLGNTRDGEPLINFERYRTAATIVKSLLRLIDASSKYEYEPVPMVIERCLWMAALSDEKILALSRSLE